jgi:hypothetical protein
MFCSPEIVGFPRSYAAAAGIALLVTACGGGGGVTCCGFEPGTASPPTPNQAPVANAGPDQFVEESSTVTLVDSGFGSFDPDGFINSVAWEQESGPAVNLKGRTFIAPIVDMRTELRFTLVVQDDQGARGSDSVRVTVDVNASDNLTDGVIDFERLPNGSLTTDFDEVGDDYSNGCVEFRNFEGTDTSKGPEYRKIEITNNTIVWDNDRTFNPPPETNFNITADFSVPISSIETDVFADVGESITMTASDSFGGILGAITSAESMACCSRVTDTISLTGVGEISTVVWKTSTPKITVPRIDNLRFSKLATCGSSLCAAAVNFNYADALNGVDSTLTASLENAPGSGSVTVNGADSASPITPFTFDWGDNTETTGWFPQGHTYLDVSKNYIVKVTAHYADGTTSEALILARFIPPDVAKVIDKPELAVTVPNEDLVLGTRLYDPPILSHFDDSFFNQVSREVVEYALTVAASLQYDYVNRDVVMVDGGFNQVVLFDANLSGGMYSLWYTSPVAFGAASTSFAATTAAYSSFFHEMGHNATLNSPADFHYGGRIDGPANAIYSETMAQIVAHVTAYDIIRQGSDLGLSCDLIFDIREDALRTARFIRHRFDNYIATGMPFASWNDPATPTDETFGTFMTLAYVFLSHAQSGGNGFAAPLKRMMLLLQNADNVLLLSRRVRTNSTAADSIRATLMIAAISYAFETDLSGEFQALNFPVDKALHDQLYIAAP